MSLKKLHYLSGITITLFVGVHLFNHLYSLFGIDAHIGLMNSLRIVYRNILVETILLVAVAIQITSGLKLFKTKRNYAKDFIYKLQIYSGLYLAAFLVIHVGAVMTGRFILDLDTNFFFGVAGINTFPFNLFFIPYYGLGVISFFGHIAAIHAMKMKTTIAGVSPKEQSYFILTLGIILSFLIIYGLTNGFQGIEIPEAYHILIGK